MTYGISEEGGLGEPVLCGNPFYDRVPIITKLEVCLIKSRVLVAGAANLIQAYAIIIKSQPENLSMMNLRKNVEKS